MCLNCYTPNTQPLWRSLALKDCSLLWVSTTMVWTQPYLMRTKRQFVVTLGDALLLKIITVKLLLIKLSNRIEKIPIHQKKFRKLIWIENKLSLSHRKWKTIHAHESPKVSSNWQIKYDALPRSRLDPINYYTYFAFESSQQ